MMDSDSEHEGLKHWVRLRDERGHAGVFARTTPEEQAIVERSTANEWRKSVLEKYGFEVGLVSSNPLPKAVPDCFAEFKSMKISLELTELVDGELLDKITEAKKHGHLLSAYHGKTFVETQWDKRRFTEKLNEILSKKAEKYIRNRNEIDVLIIHTAEPWLSPYKVDEWLSGSPIMAVDPFRSAYLLMSYHPGYSKNWPVFRLFDLDKRG